MGIHFIFVIHCSLSEGSVCEFAQCCRFYISDGGDYNPRGLNYCLSFANFVGHLLVIAIGCINC